MSTIFFEIYICCPQQWIVKFTLIVFTILFADLCSCDVYMQSQCGQTIHSPGERIYSQISYQYQPNINCSVTLKGRYSGQKIFLRIEDIDLRGTTDCHGDYLEVHGASRKPILICGKPGRIPNKVTSTGDSLHLVFNTDALNNGRGFRAVFTALFPDKQCRAHHKYRCSNKLCISSLLTCDTVNHCGDASDERPSACQNKKDEYKEKYRTVGETDVVIPELIFICIGSALVMIFLYLCIPQFITHIVYVKGKWRERKALEEVLGSAAGGSNRPSITSLRTRPSDAAFIPLHLEIRMGDLLKDPTNTLSLIRSAAPQGNDDRDRVIADAVSSGQKVKVGRFMVEKSLVQETIDEEDEYISDDDQYVPIRRREKRNIESDSDDEKRSSWIERREAKISKNLEKEGLLDYNSEDESLDDKEVLLKNRTSSTSSSRSRAQSRSRAPSRPRSYSKRSIPPDWDITDSDDPSSSHTVVRPRAATLPFKPAVKTPSLVPEWDFSSSASSPSSSAGVIDESSGASFQKPSSASGVIQDTGTPQKQSGDLISFKAEHKLGKFNVTKVIDPHTAHEVVPSNQDQNYFLESTKSSNMSTKSDKPVKIGRFSVRKNEMDRRNEQTTRTDKRPVEKCIYTSTDLNSKQGRFMISKVDEPNNEQGKEVTNETSGTTIQTKGQFSVEKVGEQSPETKTLPGTNVASEYTVSKVDENTIGIDTNKSRFSVSKVENQTEITSPNISNPNQVNSTSAWIPSTPDQKSQNPRPNTQENVLTSVSQPRSGIGRFIVHKVDEPESISSAKGSERGSPTECSDEFDIVVTEGTPMLGGNDSESDLEDIYSNDEPNKGYFETEI